MTMIAIECINDLLSASEVKTVADMALYEHEIAAVARAINLAANTGEHSVEICNPLSDKVKILLISKGYTVSECENSAVASRIFRVGWK